jgi:hypothetical protein
MTHHHMTRVLYITLVAFAITTGLTVFLYSQTFPAKAAGIIYPFTEYAGTVISVVTPVLTVPGAQAACPDYTLMQNDDINPLNPYPQFGLFYLPGQELSTYDYQTLDIPGTTHIGGYVPFFPNVACGLTPGGGPVFVPYPNPEYNGFFFLDGGTLSPQLPVTY